MDIVYKIHNFFVNRVYANSLGEELSGGLEGLGDPGGTDPGDLVEEVLLERIVQIAVPLAVICVVVLVVYAAYLLMSSQGNPDKVKEGKEVMTNAIIGFIIVLLAVVILVVLSESLGLEIYDSGGSQQDDNWIPNDWPDDVPIPE
jgi:heme/copper-type cytochrome/quinol oxidase subunit 2